MTLKKKLIVSLFIVLVIAFMVFLFPKSSYQWGSGTGTILDCECFGFNKVSGNFIGGGSEVCFGQVYDCKSNTELQKENEIYYHSVKQNLDVLQNQEKNNNLESKDLDIGIDWQIYRNEEFGFLFWKPNNWQIKEVNVSESLYYNDQHKLVLKIEPIEPMSFEIDNGVGYNASIEFRLYKNKENYTPEEFLIERSGSGHKLIEVKNINNNEVIIYETGGMVGGLAAAWEKDNYIYYFGNFLAPLEDFNFILQSFKFLN